MKIDLIFQEIKYEFTASDYIQVINLAILIVGKNPENILAIIQEILPNQQEIDLNFIKNYLSE